MSPALAFLTSIFCMPSMVKIAVTLARSRRAVAMAMQTTGSPTFTRPLTIRPKAIRPR